MKRAAYPERVRWGLQHPHHACDDRCGVRYVVVGWDAEGRAVLRRERRQTDGTWQQETAKGPGRSGR